MQPSELELATRLQDKTKPAVFPCQIADCSACRIEPSLTMRGSLSGRVRADARGELARFGPYRQRARCDAAMFERFVFAADNLTQSAVVRRRASPTPCCLVPPAETAVVPVAGLISVYAGNTAIPGARSRGRPRSSEQSLRRLEPLAEGPEVSPPTPRALGRVAKGS
jgi:hypothetical protein